MRPLTRSLAIALVCVLALGLVAATLTSPTTTGGGSGESVLITEETDGQLNQTSQQNDGNEVTVGVLSDSDLACGDDSVDGLVYILLVCLGFLVLAIVVGLLLNARWGISLGLMALAPMPVVLLLLFGGCGWSPQPWEQTRGAVTEVAGEAGEAAESAGSTASDGLVVTSPPLLFGVAIVALLVVLAGSVLWSRNDRELSDYLDLESQTRTGPQRTIGRAAGDAAREIEDDADLENAVYEAWAEMASALHVDHPDTSTTKEFAAAARAAGIEADDVDELTRLFEEVRYGTARPTPVREQRAVDALRRIERHYATDSEPPDAAGNDGEGD